MSALDAAGELAALFPDVRSITIAGRAIELKQMGLAQGSRILRMAGPILAVRGDGELTLFEWVADHPDEANPLIVAASGLDPDWVAKLGDDDRCELASHLSELNAGFFARRLIPNQARVKVATDAINGDGPMRSTASSPADTPTPAVTRPSKPASTSRPPRVDSAATALPA